MRVEARVSWGGELVAVGSVTARSVVRLGDFGLPIPGDDDVVVAVISRGRVVLVEHAIVRGAVVVWLRVVEEARPPRAFGDRRLAKGVALGVVLHATLLSMAFIGRASAAEEEQTTLARLRTYSAALDARDSAAKVEELDIVPGAPADAPGASAEPKEAGRAGTPTGWRAPAQGRRRETGSTREEAASFGMIRLLAGATSGDGFAEHEAPSARGSIFGDSIGDSFGFGGAALSGTGEGGGGKGGGVAFEGFAGSGTCGLGCVGGQNGHGRFGGVGIGSRGGHVVKSPVLRCPGADAEGREPCSTQVSGRLPPEVVQRIVRQNFGRFRMCYEAGLHRNPSLEGRITVKFVIDREGAVAMASAGAADFADREVTACVVRGFQSLSFPPPEGGIVTVVYPLALST